MALKCSISPVWGRLVLYLKGVVDVTQQAEFEVLLYPHPSLIILKPLFWAISWQN